MRRSDGSIQSANTPARGSLASEKVEVDNGVYRCMVVEVYYTDDEGNLTFDNKQVTYDCVVLGGRREGQVIPNCKLQAKYGGQYTYSERILRKAESPFAGQSGKRLSEQKGDVVYVQFVGKTSNPVITGLGCHPLDKTQTGGTRANGPVSKEEYNGVHQSINKDGEFELTRKGGTLSGKGYFVPADRATEEEGGQAAEFPFLARLKMSGTSIVLEDAKSQLTLDLEAESYEIKLTNDTVIRANGKTGVITISADAGTNVITINKDGQLSIKASGKVTIDAPLVDVGENASYSATLFENLKQEFDSHIHQIPSTAFVGPLPVVGTTGVPAVPLISLVGSQSVKVKE